ncbi:toll/interleukin-1 receptor domain-containing protein [Mycolicibacterium sp.]|uniref:toll/interleukin-1 receptor domain-containing protein n=1 Tax=Mycolicibacterium sp. TaxID=2320850 RepID=UPI003D0B177C
MQAAPGAVDRDRAASPAAATFDAFLSYAHEDRPAATGVQKALHRIGRRIGQLRALRVFRDDTNLEASQDLWGRITAAMDQARHMVVVLSPHAAGSRWVNAEVEYWLQRRGTPPMMVLAGGRLTWDERNRCFDPSRSDAAPPVLLDPGSVPVEPFYIDISEDGPPWTPSAAGFRDKLTALAATIHGKPKDVLAGDDLREHRRFRLLRAGAVTALALLSVVAVVAGLIAWNSRQDAVRQRDEAIAARLTAEARSMLENSISGNDVTALRNLLAARTITENPDDGALYNAVVEKANVVRIIDTGHAVYGGAVSPDGTRFVAGGAHTTIRMWDLRTGQPVGRPLEGHEKLILGVAMTADGRTIATASADSTVRLWDGETGAPIGEPGRGHEGNVNAVAFSPDGTLLASAGDDRTVRLWDARTGAPRGTLLGHEGEVVALSFSPGGTLASVGRDRFIRLWDVTTKAPTGPQFTPVTMMTFGVTWSPVADSHQLVTAGADKLIRIWDARTGQQIGELAGHRAGVLNTRFSSDGRTLVSGGFDKTVRMWDVEARAPIGDPLTGPDGTVAVTLLGDDRHVVGVSNDHTIRLYDTRAAQPWQAHDGPVTGVVASPDRSLLASTSWDLSVIVWDSGSGREIRRLLGHQAQITSVAFGPRGHVASGDINGKVHLWAVDNAEPLLTVYDIGDQINGLAFSPDGRVLVLASHYRKALRFIDLTTGATADVADPREFPPVAVAFSPDGELLASGSEVAIHMWDPDERERAGDPLEGLDEYITSVAFAPDGDRLVAGSGDHRLRLFDVPERRMLSVSPPEQAIMGTVAFSGDGDHVVTGAVDGTVRLWSVTGDELRPVGSPLVGHEEQVSRVAFTADGTRFVSASLDATLREWPAVADPADLCAKLSPISDAEWNALVAPAVPKRPACP